MVAPPETSILALTPADARARLAAWVTERGLPAYRLEQLVRRLWVAPIEAWSSATELPQALRNDLDAAFPLLRLDPVTIQQSQDGTTKYLWRLHDGEMIESVLIPSGSRRTLCISSQAGCALGCVFCATGTMGFRRNLTAAEIACQVREVVLRNADDKPTNVVYMGMGEPLLNWPAVDVSLSILNDEEGIRHRGSAHHRVDRRHPSRHGEVRRAAGAVPAGHLAARTHGRRGGWR